MVSLISTLRDRNEATDMTCERIDLVDRMQIQHGDAIWKRLK